VVRRTARPWLTALGIKARTVRLREYIGKMTDADIAHLQRDRDIAEAEGDLRLLAREALQFADALATPDEELRSLAQAKARIDSEQELRTDGEAASVNGTAVVQAIKNAVAPDTFEHDLEHDYQHDLMQRAHRTPIAEIMAKQLGVTVPTAMQRRKL